VGLLGSEYSQPHCFFSGPVDFYSSWCKWADKGTVGTGLRPSCMLSHSGQVVLSSCHAGSGVLQQCLWQACLELSPHGCRYHCCEREFITSVESCWSPDSGGSQKAPHTSEQCYRRKQLERQRGNDCDKQSHFQLCHTLPSSTVVFSSPFEGTFCVIVQLFLGSDSCVSLSQAIVSPLSTMLFVLVDIQSYAWHFLLCEVEEVHVWDTCKIEKVLSRSQYNDTFGRGVFYSQCQWDEWRVKPTSSANHRVITWNLTQAVSFFVWTL